MFLQRQEFVLAGVDWEPLKAGDYRVRLLLRAELPLMALTENWFQAALVLELRRSDGELEEFRVESESYTKANMLDAVFGGVKNHALRTSDCMSSAVHDLMVEVLGPPPTRNTADD